MAASAVVLVEKVSRSCYNGGMGRLDRPIVQARPKESFDSRSSKGGSVMRTLFGLLSALIFSNAATAGEAVVDLSKHLGETPALVIVVCAGDSRDLPTVAGLIEMTPWTIFCRGGASREMGKLRTWAQEKGLFGSRVYLACDDSSSLWLAGDLADAVWVTPGAKNPPPEKEILRVLHPGGVAIVSGKAIVKPRPPGVDEWRHPYHAPDNNVVSNDRVARLPGELRFQTHPVFAPMPSQTLFAGGRIFFFSGQIAFHEREEPLLNTLTVLNAYNGLRLWSRPLDPNYVVHNFVKLATGSEVVYAEGPNLLMLDAATGRQRGNFRVPPQAAEAGDTDWKWIAHDNDTLWAAFGPPDARVAPHQQKREMGHWPWEVANEQYQGITDNFGTARRLAAYQYPEMELLWSVGESEAFDARALCISEGRLFQLAPHKYVAARDAATGEQLWRHTPESAKELFEAIGSALKRQGWGLGWSTYCCARASNGVVCIAGPSFKKTIGIGLDKGELFWASDTESPHPFFLKDALYVMPRVASGRAVCRRIDPLTGKNLDEFGLGVIGSCTRLTATADQFFYRPGGGEGRTVYVDLSERKLASYEGIVRPGCFDGVVPANGRLYWMPLACDCWQIHGTVSMAPRAKLSEPSTNKESPAWDSPTSSQPATRGDWPMFRANASGTATIATGVPRKVKELWRQRLPGGGLTAPVCAAGRVFIGTSDGTVHALDAQTGRVLWQTSSAAAVLHPPVYWKGRVVFGSCDGSLYCIDASNGRLLGRIEVAPEKRFVNIMDRLVSTWPLGGGVVVGDDGVAYAAAGTTAADGAMVAAVDLADGTVRWRKAYTLDGERPELSFGVQGNLLLKNGTLYINGGAPVGIVALDAQTGGNPRVVRKHQAGMEMFLQPDDTPLSTGAELFSNKSTSPSLFNRTQGRLYFEMGDRHLALISRRLFCARDPRALDGILDWANKPPRPNEGKEFRDIMQAPTDDSGLWASVAADLCGLAIGKDGIVALRDQSVEGLSLDGRALWTIPLSSSPVGWGAALSDRHCTVTLSDGSVLCLGDDSN
jgi:outer membrane protein assembly factor BamB